MNKGTLLEEIIKLLDESNLPKEAVQAIRIARLSKRARIVVKHILEYGFITTEDLEKKYGYNHPPRAARDVRESGVPLDTFQVESSDGRQIAAYKLGNLEEIRKDRLDGRIVFSKKFKEELYAIGDGKCAVCSGRFVKRYLQIDHKIPYEVSGEKEKSKRNMKEYMLLCSSCNRAKSWSCEHCLNWLSEKSMQICSKCYWASPENYAHIALREIRRVDILWDEKEIQTYEKLKREAQESKHTIPDYVKKIVINHLKG